MVENSFQNLGQFSIRVRFGSAEIEISAPDRDFVLGESNRLIEQFKLNATTPHQTHVEVVQGEVTAIPEQPQTRSVKPQTFGEFIKQFAHLQTNLEKILVYGYWCEIKQGQPHFTEDDILTRYKEARETQPAYIKRDLRSLISKGFLLPEEKSENGTSIYSLSNSGIKEVESKMSPA